MLLHFFERGNAKLIVTEFPSEFAAVLYILVGTTWYSLAFKTAFDCLVNSTSADDVSMTTIS